MMDGVPEVKVGEASLLALCLWATADRRLGFEPN